jgi:hypothetical protein
MARCWQTRGCDEEMQSTCLHHTDFQDRCPTKCAFTKCDRPQHALTTDPELIFDTNVDREDAIKEACLFCEFYLKNGPRVSA